MTIVLYITSYLAAFATMALVPATVSFALFLPFAFLARRFKFTRPALSFFISGVGTVFAIWLFVRLAANTSLHASIAMFILPASVAYWNDRVRINRAKQGQSIVKNLMQASGEAASYDHQSDVHTELGHLWGDGFGYAFGIMFYLREAAWF